MENQIAKIESANALEALNRSEVDVQVATAKRYPRDINGAIQKIVSYGTATQSTAEECFYALRRGGANGGGTAIEGPSIRLAEIVAASWGNLRVSSQIIGNDGHVITARGICYDLENNVAVSSEVRRRITDKNGKTFSEDMQVVTGNAAAAIAFRNVVFKVVPKAVINDAIAQIKGVVINGVAHDFEQQKKSMFTYFAELGVTKTMLLEYLGHKTDSEVTPEDIAELRAVAVALREGQATVDDLFTTTHVGQETKATGAINTSERIKAAMAKNNARKQEVQQSRSPRVTPAPPTPEIQEESGKDDLPFD